MSCPVLGRIAWALSDSVTCACKALMIGYANCISAVTDPSVRMEILASFCCTSITPTDPNYGIYITSVGTTMFDEGVSRSMAWTSWIPYHVQLIICALGIYVCYLRYGILQERIYASEHGPDGGRYSFSLPLVALQTAVNAAGAAIVLMLGALQTSHPNKPTSVILKRIPIFEYSVVSLSYLSATIVSFTALNYVSHPMQAVEKSFKMISVMLMGVVIRRRRYSVLNYPCVALVTVGVAIFSWKNSRSTRPGSPFGFALLLASLFMDGITGSLQECLVVRYSPSSHELMLWQNVGAVLWLTPVRFITGEGSHAISYVMKYPNAITDIVSLTIVSALGQNFIYYTIRNFSALTVTTITTTRKMLSVLLSVFANRHSLVPRQWIGLFLVFTAITWEAVDKQRSNFVKLDKLSKKIK